MRLWLCQKFGMDPKLQYARENTYTESGGSKNLTGDCIITCKIIFASYFSFLVMLVSAGQLNSTILHVLSFVFQMTKSGLLWGTFCAVFIERFN